MKRVLVALLLTVMTQPATQVRATDAVTTGSLLEQMIALPALAVFPVPAFDVVQFSSHDRRSQIPGGPDWFANSDGFGREPIPGFEATLQEPENDGVGEYLICDVRGPGAVVRLWTARIFGEVRVYLDDMDQPLYAGPAQDFFLRAHRSFAVAQGLDTALFDEVFSQRNACYLPMPFGERCRVVWRGDITKAHFYELEVRRYEPGTKVRTFVGADLKTFRPLVEQVARAFADPDHALNDSSARVAGISAQVPAGATVDLLAAKGSAAIDRLLLTVKAADRDRALRQTVLQIFFDGFSVPQVEAPLGDFFGAAPGVNPYDSLPFTVRGSGEMICRFRMPFKESARIVVANLGDQPVSIEGSASSVAHAWQEGRSMHFHAHWRVGHDLVASPANPVDLPFLLSEGQGVYVGTASLLLNPSPVPHSYGSWWGEGDEKIFVDGAVKPAFFGTGSEDYYNYAWSERDIFAFPYFAQPRNDGPGNRGFVTNNRWHILDRLPFQRSFAFYMELISHEPTPGMSYARMAYCYGRPGMIDDHAPITADSVRAPELPASWEPIAVKGSQNSVFFPVEDQVVNAASTAIENGRLWQGGKLLNWRPEHPGDVLSLQFPVEKTGKYIVRLVAALTPHGGRIGVTLNGERSGFGGKEGVIDLHVPWRHMLRAFASEEVALQPGTQKLEITYQGAPEQAEPPVQIGLDFLWVQQR